MPLDIKDAAEFEFIWKTGTTPSGEEVKIEDALSVTGAAMLMPKVISNIVKEAAEPLLVGTSLLQRINYSAGQQITFPAVGALVASDIAEGQEYPERSMQIGGSTVTASIGKSGLAVKLTEEMVRYSQFDIIGMHLRAAGKALARHKEQKIFNMIRGLGVKIFDNVNPTLSVKGVTTGRNIQGAGNGSLTMDDLFDAYAQVVTQGFVPNTLLMHPLTWTLFVKDPTLRAFVLANGGGTFFATWNGNPAGLAPWGSSSQGGLGMSSGQNLLPNNNAGLTSSPLNSYPQTLNSAPTLPGYFNIPFRIIVSPMVFYDPKRQLTDIYLFDSSELGVLIVDEDVMTEEWNDPRVDIKKIKLRERYGMAILNEGQGVGVIKNVHVVPNEIVLPAQATIDVSGNLGPLTPSTNVLG